MLSCIGPSSDNSSYLSGTWSPSSGWTSNNNSPYVYSTAIIEGAWEEDEPFTRSKNHFWDPDSTYDDGLLLFSSALEAAQDRFNNAINNYNNSNKKEAYWWLGRTAHLLMDMTVPAHAMLDWHANPIYFTSTDSYEQYTAYSENKGEKFKIILEYDYHHIFDLCFYF